MEFWLTIENWIVHYTTRNEVHYTTRNEVEGGGGGTLDSPRSSVRLSVRPLVSGW